jgi:hypothetical protein
MNKQRKTSHILNVFQYDADGHVVLPASLTLTIAPGSEDNNSKVPTTAWVRALISSLGYVTLASDQTITGLKTIVRVGASVDVLNFKIGTDTIYGLKVAYNQNELVESGEATWSLVNTFNRNGTGFSVTPVSFFRGVLVTGERLLSASVNANLLDYYSNNPSGRYPVYAYNTGVQQFSTGIIVGKTTGVVNAATGAISDLPSGVVANFGGRVIGSNAVNSNEFVTLTQLDSYVPTSRTLTINGTTFDLSANRTWTIPAGVTSFNTRTGAITLSSGDVTGALGYTPYNSTNPSGYITGITSGMVTTALGFTPYNATNPSGYTSNLGTVTSVSGTGTVSGLTLSGTVSSSGNITLGGTLSLTSGNVTSALGYTPVQPNGTGASGTWGINITGNATYSLNSTRLYASDAPYTYGGASPYYMTMTYDGSRWLLQVTPGTPAAVRVSYADSAGSASSASSASTSSQVTINYNNDSNSTYQLLWGSGNSVYGSAQVYVNPSSDIIYARGGYISPSNAWGTSDSAFFPNGITTAGTTNWIYGSTTHIGNATGNGAGHDFYSSGSSYSTGNLETNGSFRAPIFYDRNDTGYYIDGHNISSLNILNIGNGSGGNQRIVFRAGNDASAYSALRFEYAGTERNTIHLFGPNWQSGSLLLSGGAINLSGHTGVTFGPWNVPVMWVDNSGNAQANESMRAPIFYDSNNTGYYVDAASGSRIANIQADYIGVGQAINTGYRIITSGDYYANAGGNYWAEGRFKQYRGSGTWHDVIDTGNIGSQQVNNLSTNYAGGQQLNPQVYFNNGIGLKVAMTATAGYWSDTLWINGYAGGDVLSMCAMHFQRNGTPRLYVSTQQSTSSSYGTLYEIYSSYNLDAPNKSGTSYYQTNTWMQFNGFYGLYWPSQYGAHLSPNDLTTYTQFTLRGNKNGYGGINDGYSQVQGMMYDSGGNGGVYREANSRWYFYYHLGNDCMGVGTSSTSSTYSLYLNKGIYAPSRIDATIFYDASNTGYYLDPNGASYLASSLEIASGYVLTNGVGGSMYMNSAAGGFGGYFQCARHLVIETLQASHHVYVLDSSGTGVVKYSGAQSWSAHSDIRIKTVHSTLENNLSKLENINPINYSFNNFDDDRNRIGLVAQEVQEHFPELVTLDPKTDYLMLDYTGLIPVLLGAIKELKNKVEVLESQL